MFKNTYLLPDKLGLICFEYTAECFHGRTNELSLRDVSKFKCYTYVTLSWVASR